MVVPYDLALILNYVEETGKWPSQLMDAYASLIPKDDTLVDVEVLVIRSYSMLPA